MEQTTKTDPLSNHSFKQKRIRLLYLPNEGSPTSQQVGPRKAFEHNLSQNAIEDYKAFSFLVESAKLGGDHRACEKLLEIVREFRPNVIFWQHIGGFRITSDFLDKLKNCPSRPKLVYHEADAYDRYIKRMDTYCRLMISNADMVILVGLGNIAKLARSYNAKLIIHAPQNYDNLRFGHPWTPSKKRDYKLVMIGSAGRTRIPGRFMPGGKNRIKLVHLLNKTFGEQFAVYGYGWDGISSHKGFAPFDRQHEYIRSGWISINWDHYDDIPFYFSNRLPISISAGVPHVTTYHKGYDIFFRECKGGLYFAHSINDAVDIAEYLLSRPIDFLIEEGLKCKQFAEKFMEANIVYSNILVKIKEQFDFD